MKKINTLTIATVTALALVLGVTSSLAEGFTVTFGSDNDGLGGFTQNTLTSTNTFWSTQTGSVKYRNQDAGTQNSSFLRAIGIDRSNGTTTTIKGTLTWAKGYADDNNRLGMYFFGDTVDLTGGIPAPGQNESGALGLIFNTDDDAVNDFGTGDNTDDNLTWFNGIDNGAITSTLRNQTSETFAGFLTNTVIELGANLSFYADGTNDMIQIDGFMIAAGDLTTVSTNVLAADYTGNVFGFVGRNRARNYPNTLDPRGQPWEVEYETFTVIPEPATFGLFAMMGGGILFFRRRFGK